MTSNLAFTVRKERRYMSLPDPIRSAVDRVAEILTSVEDILFITGAGLSADSGLPTYRGVAGLYNDADTEDGLPVEEILTGPMLVNRPELVWKYLGQVGRAANRAEPNRGHGVIAEMQEHFARVRVLTQNIDDLHNKAGSVEAMEIHGNMRSLRCDVCGHRTHVEDFEAIEIPPLCSECDRPMRPDVVLFGEMLPIHVLTRLERELEMGFGAVFSVGTSSLFPYTAMPVQMAARAGVPCIEINPEETYVSRWASERIPLGAAEALDAIWTRFLDVTAKM